MCTMGDKLITKILKFIEFCCRQICYVDGGTLLRNRTEVLLSLLLRCHCAVGLAFNTYFYSIKYG